MTIDITNIKMQYGKILEKYFSRSSLAYVIAPFINNRTLERILPPGKDAIIITSWRSDYIKSGYSSLELYEFCIKHNWTLYVNNSLHAKIYSDSLNDCFIGSANVTDAALFSDTGNIECMSFLPHLDVASRIQIETIRAQSNMVNERIYQLYSDWFSKLDEKCTDVCVDPPNLDNESFFYISQLPATDNPHKLRAYLSNQENIDLAIEHDLAVFGMCGLESSEEFFYKKLSKNFFEQPFIHYFKQKIMNGPTFFGEAKEWIQNNCADVPLPYRRDLTQLVHNLFNWFEIMDPRHFEITVPYRHSQCICYKPD